MNSNMRSSKLYFLIIVLSILALNSSAQEVLLPLGSNDIVRAEWIKRHQTVTNLRIATSASDTISLPFLDDFSTTLIYTDTVHWLDNAVYVNRDMPIGPITVGVATFDGVSKNGTPYDTVTTNANQSRSCDTLSSKPIDMSGIASTDTSVYLSFFYEAQGRGEKPDPDDSLLLEFHKPANPDSVWTKIWGHQGFSNLQSTDSIFRLVMIRVDSSYFKKGFKFRFRNKATPSGYVDQWHVDYVYLKQNRSAVDTMFNDVSFVYTPSSLLKKYQAMPYEQYFPIEMTDSLTNYIRNNDDTIIYTSYYHKLYDAASALLYTSVTGNGNIESIFDYSYTICTIPTTGCHTLLRPPFGYTIGGPISSPTAFTIEHVITPTSDFLIENDTIRRKQIFDNYYAYDDGTAELAYGLNVAGAQLAYKFTLTIADTLRGLDMYFNWMPDAPTNTNSVTQRQFRITVWNDNSGQPGSIVYQDSIVTPAEQYEYHSDWGDLTNMFYRFPLTTPKALSGTFYVGWVQYTNTLLNIGFDRNINSNSKMWFRTGSNWNPSVLPGSWMIRPLFGTAAQMQGVTEHKTGSNSVSLYPNPANDELFVQTAAINFDRMQIMIMDAFGRVVIREQKLTSNSIDVSSLNNGIYFVHITDEQGHPFTRKLIIAR